jgi:HAD superfamily hydrolase (TIGR01509 family)
LAKKQQDRNRAYRDEVTSSPAIPRPDALLLDIDGTLVDSNYLHVFAWAQAFQELDRQVPAWRVHRAIGMDSDLLLSTVLGDQDAARIGDQAKDRHAARYAALASLLQVLPGARGVVRDIAGWGVKVVLATSAPPDELAKLRAVLDVEDALFAITGAQDVSTAKPAPDIVAVALDKAGVAPDQALFVGDTVWDVEAAARAGVACVGLRSGGFGAAELRQAGAIAVFDDIAGLHQDVQGSWTE